MLNKQYNHNNGNNDNNHQLLKSFNSKILYKYRFN